MSKILLVNPNKWGRGITNIWIASHAASLKASGHEVRLFDATFYDSWSVNETRFNTENKQYKPSDYYDYVSYSGGDIAAEFNEMAETFVPDIVFWSAISSHIHGEGEYVNIQYGHQLASFYSGHAGLLRITGGLQATAAPALILDNMPGIDFLIRGESELVLCEIANLVDKGEIEAIKRVDGIAYKDNENRTSESPKQNILGDMDEIPFYDYSLFEDQAFFRPYNGRVVRAVDYELSRGCIYSCEYCVETIIQNYYGFDKIGKRGSIRNSNKYLRNKSAARVFEEIKCLHRELDIELFRCQDTNFLTIDRAMLIQLAELVDASGLNIKLYVETRPEGINGAAVKLLKKLKVDGVGMGIELSTQSFREDKLRRYASTEKIVNAFRLLREAGIKRTAYNIIGLPDQDECSIIETIKFNRELDPDNITVAFYSPYIGTAQQIKAKDLGYFDDYEFHIDGQLRTLSKDTLVDKKTLNFYKSHFNVLLEEGFGKLDQYKLSEGLEPYKQTTRDAIHIREI